MAVTIDGTTGVSAVQAGAVTTSDLPAGSVLQVVSTTLSTQVSVSSSSDTDVGLTATITPTSASSKILIIASVAIQVNGSPNSNVTAGWQIKTSGNAIVLGGTNFSQGIYSTVGSYNLNGTQAKHILVSPNTTSAITYKLTGRVNGATSIVFNYTESGDFPVCTLTLMEIAA
jgi:hypothetical protein